MQGSLHFPLIRAKSQHSAYSAEGSKARIVLWYEGRFGSLAMRPATTLNDVLNRNDISSFPNRSYSVRWLYTYPMHTYERRKATQRTREGPRKGRSEELSHGIFRTTKGCPNFACSLKPKIGKGFFFRLLHIPSGIRDVLETGFVSTAMRHSRVNQDPRFHQLFEQIFARQLISMTMHENEFEYNSRSFYFH